MFFGWLKHYMPRSLYGRAALILVLPVLTLQLAISVVFIQRHFADVTEQMTRSIVLELRHLTETLEGAPPGRARPAANSVADPLDFEIELPAADIPAQDRFRSLDLSGRAVIATLRRGLPDLLAADVTVNRRVYVWLGTSRGPLQVSFSRRRVSASNPHQLLVVMVVLGGLMTLVSAVFLRNQLRPINRLANAATDYGRGRLTRYTPSGATEVRAAGNAFLDMRGRIERQIQQRTMMLSGVSHDLRTPLTRLKLGLSMLEDEEVEPLKRDVQEMQDMLDGYLDFARGVAADGREPVDPRSFVEALHADATRAGRPVSLGRMEGEGRVPMNALAIRRAIGNLITNADRFASRIRLSYALTDRALRLTVEDDGPGIPEAEREEALKPFSRLDPARNQNEGGGVGLGLAIAADVARSHGGLLRLGQSEDLGGLKVDLVVAV